MKKFITYISVFAVLVIMSSCGATLEEINTDPNNPVTVDLKLMLPEIQSQSAFNEGTNPNRVAGICMQQFFGLDAQQLGYNSYLLGPSVMNNYWSTGLYAGVLRSCDVMRNSAGERPFYGAVAKIIMANELGKATSFFGDIPYTEAFLGTENLTPGYDSQESIYGTVQSLLDEAIATLTAGSGGYNGGDLIYGGDAAAWIAAAHGFKARYYMHTSKRNSGDYAKALAEVQSSFTSNEAAPSFTFQTAETANWSLAKFGIERPATLGIDNRFAAMMDGDPRQDLYMSFDGTQWGFFDGNAGPIWGRSDASVPLISYVELKFIEAEATAAAGGDASDALKAGIQASFDLVGATDDGYVDAASADASLSNIMTEAYKAYYGFNFHETFANWRRTGLPALSPNADGDNGFNPGGGIPLRYIYAESEDQTNRENVTAAKDSQGGGLLNQPVWAFE